MQARWALPPLSVAFLGLALAARADIVSLKDGSVIECTVKETTVKNNRPVVVLEMEDGKRQEVDQDQIAWMAKAKPSWIVRKENQEWYAKEKVKLGDKGAEIKAADHERVGRECRRRKLDKEADEHFTKAYEIKAADAKETIADHEGIARWLERPCGLFDLAGKEWKWVLDKKMAEFAEKGKEKPTDFMSLASYAEKHALYDEADDLFKKALELDPKLTGATKGIERIKQLRETLVNTKLFRTIKEPFGQATASYKGKQSGDGSYGGDADEGGVQGLRAMTAICTLALIGQWEFDAVDKPDASRTVPANIDKSLKFLLGADCQPKKLRGPDVWGNVWSLMLFAKILQKPNMKTYHEQIKTKLGQVFQALAAQASPQGGWMYYDFAKNSPASFVTGVGIVAMTDLKAEGVQVPEDIYTRAASILKQLKQEDAVWSYRTGAPQKVEGSQGRASLCELALFMTGQGSTAAIQLAIENFFKYRHILEAVKSKMGTHIGGGGTAPYYFLFGHYWTARACQKLAAASRDGYASRLRDLILKDQETDGSFTDFPMLKDHHKTYGAALGAMTLYYIGTLERDPKQRR